MRTIISNFMKIQTNVWGGVFLSILFLQIINIVYWGTCKEGYFGDELYSFQFICQTEYPSINANRPEANYLNNWHSSEYYQDYFTISDEEAFDFAGVYNSIKKDVHPPLYYILLMIMCSFFRKFSKWSFILLNIIFFVLSDFILYQICKKLISIKFGQIIPCLLWGFSVGTVTMAVFARMYMQLTCATLFYVYMHFILMEHVINKNTIEKRILIGICGATIFGTLTQYYFLIFAFFLSACIWIFLWLYRRRIAIEYTITMFLGLLSSYVIFPSMYNQIFKEYRGNEAFENIKSAFDFGRLRNFVNLLSREIFSGKLKLLVFGILVLFLTGIFIHLYQIEYKPSEMGEVRFVISRRRIEKISIKITKKVIFIFFLLVTIILDILVISKIAPYQSDRYIFNIQPIAILIVVVMGSILCGWISKRYDLKILCIIVMSLITISGYFVTGVGYLYKGGNERIEIANSYADLPIILLTYNNARFTSCNDAFYFQNGQNVYPIDEKGIDEIYKVLDEVQASSFILHIDKSYDSVDDQLAMIKNNVGAIKSKWIYSTNSSAVYLIER